MEWTKVTKRYGFWQLNGGEPDADGVLCTVAHVEPDEFLWSVDNVEDHHLIAHGSASTLEAAKEAAERVYSPLFPVHLFGRDPRSRADAARREATAASTGDVHRKGLSH